VPSNKIKLLKTDYKNPGNIDIQKQKNIELNKRTKKGKKKIAVPMIRKKILFLPRLLEIYILITCMANIT